MTEVNFNTATAIYSKTAAGQQEIQSRALGLSPIVRRILVLVDGQRSGAELAAFAAGQDFSAIVTELLEKGCVDAKVAVAPVKPAPAPAAEPQAPDVAAPAGPLSADLAGLPPPEMRSAKEVDMARNFMMNTVNTIFGQNTRFTLMEAIFACKTAEDTRRVYSMWAEALSGNRVGAKRLPELREKLFQVL